MIVDRSVVAAIAQLFPPPLTRGSEVRLMWLSEVLGHALRLRFYALIEKRVNAVRVCNLGSTSQVDLGPEKRDLVLQRGLADIDVPDLGRPSLPSHHRYSIMSATSIRQGA
jgi:hypothetical protein